jgi:uncharacterized protein YndB with AHSA1/START domain
MKEKDYDIIKKEIVINASVDKVFSALIDPEQLTQWFPNIATIEPWAGGKVFFRFSKQVTKEKKDHDVIGTIISIIPIKRFRILGTLQRNQNIIKILLLLGKLNI